MLLTRHVVIGHRKKIVLRAMDLMSAFCIFIACGVHLASLAGGTWFCGINMIRRLFVLCCAICCLGLGRISAQDVGRLAELLYGCSLCAEEDVDSFSCGVVFLEGLRDSARDEVEGAVIASVLGTIYARNAWRAGGEVGAYDDYAEAARRNFLYSVTNPQLLARASASDYAPLVKSGAGDVYFNGDLLHILGKRAAGSATNGGAFRDRVFHIMADTYRALGNREALLLVLLDSLYRGEYACGEMVERVKEADYEELARAFAPLPLACEVYIRFAESDAPLKRRLWWAEQGARLYAGNPRSAVLRNKIAQWTAPMVEPLCERVVRAGEEFDLRIQHRNTKGVMLSVHGKDKKKEDGYDECDTLAFTPSEPYVIKEDTFRVSAPPTVGTYEVTFHMHGTQVLSLTMEVTDVETAENYVRLQYEEEVRLEDEPQLVFGCFDERFFPSEEREIPIYYEK